jgi:hypothetical protein
MINFQKNVRFVDKKLKNMVKKYNCLEIIFKQSSNNLKEHEKGIY